MGDPSNSEAQPAVRNGRATVAICAGVVFAMVGLAYASVPLYRLFCQVTGFGGTPQIAEAGAETILDRRMKIRFDANVADIGWDFRPAEIEIDIAIGETRLAFYEATNLTSKTLTGTATFNVTPLEAGAYFSKIDCFCFTEQTLAAGQRVDMPVSFYVDPAIADDTELDDVKTITLSYTFFETDPPKTKLSAGDDLAKSAAAPVDAAVN